MKRFEGEAAYKNHAKVYIPTAQGNLCAVWVKITKGNKTAGEGIIDHEPKVPCRCSDGILKFGTVIKFAGGTERVRPKFVRKVHVANQVDTLKRELALSLVESMTQFKKGH